jgi:hypothetical protein
MIFKCCISPKYDEATILHAVPHGTNLTVDEQEYFPVLVHRMLEKGAVSLTSCEDLVGKGVHRGSVRYHGTHLDVQHIK